jgi:hypothetical protein
VEPRALVGMQWQDIAGTGGHPQIGTSLGLADANTPSTAGP